MILHRIDNWLYNAGLAVALMIVLFGVMLCLTALLRREHGPRVAPRLVEDGVLRDK